MQENNLKNIQVKHESKSISSKATYLDSTFVDK